MPQAVPMQVIATIHSQFPTKFGIPRQSGLVPTLQAQVIFEPEYRNPEAVRGLEGYSHIWLIWQFSESKQDGWSPTVRPPRLGGNRRMGVFATRSPNRPNPIGLSSVQLEGIDFDHPCGPVLQVLGADLMDGSPIFDIKPYVPYADSHPEASSGFVSTAGNQPLEVVFPPELLERVPSGLRQSLIAVLAQDPRPAYHHSPDRVYGFEFADFEVRFTVSGSRLTVCELASR